MFFVTCFRCSRCLLSVHFISTFSTLADNHFWLWAWNSKCRNFVRCVRGRREQSVTVCSVGFQKHILSWQLFPYGTFIFQSCCDLKEHFILCVCSHLYPVYTVYTFKCQNKTEKRITQRSARSLVKPRGGRCPETAKLQQSKIQQQISQQGTRDCLCDRRKIFLNVEMLRESANYPIKIVCL